MKVALLAYRLSGVRSGAHLAHLELGRFLQRRGHEVRLAALKGQRRTRFGDQVALGLGELVRAISWADAALVRDEPHVGALLPLCTGRTLYACHSPAGDPRELGLRLSDKTTLVWISGVVRDFCEHAHGAIADSVVIEGCPMDLSAYRTKPGDRVTLVNLSERKGGRLFWQLARRMPDVRFLGVQGWGDQILCDPLPPNVEVVKNVVDPRHFYRRTRVILLPSADPGTVQVAKLPSWGEGWNRVGIEAAASGIPSIAHPTPGIVAPLGRAAIYVDRSDIEGWVGALRDLERPDLYAELSRIALARAAEVEVHRDDLLAAYEDLLAGVPA